jgi:hypothetical protein
MTDCLLSGNQMTVRAGTLNKDSIQKALNHKIMNSPIFKVSSNAGHPNGHFPVFQLCTK